MGTCTLAVDDITVMNMTADSGEEAMLAILHQIISVYTGYATYLPPML